MIECEYCGADDVVLYGWHADAWCGRCIEAYKSSTLRLVGTLKDAPRGRPVFDPSDKDGYAKPFILQMPDGSMIDGAVQ